jgi:hypothetical protein
MYAVRGPNSLKQQLDQKNNYAYFDQLIERSDFTKLGQGKKSSAFEKNFERKIHAKKLPSSFISTYLEFHLYFKRSRGIKSIFSLALIEV